MVTLNKKLIRDLKQLRGQVITIALVVAVGVGALIGAISTRESLRQAQADFYLTHHFADVFASMKQAPNYLLTRLQYIPGVNQIEPRIVKEVTLDMPNMQEPAVGRFISIPETGKPILNQLIIIKGRRLHPGKYDELLVNEAFAKAHDISLGQSITAILNGKQQQFTIVGIAISPEYIYAIRPADLLPDDAHFGIFWGNRQAFAAAFGLENAFNSLSLSLTKTANVPAVIQQLDERLEPYGGLGAATRQAQISHRFVSDEIRQLGFLATVIPSIFLLVATFLLNIVTSRLVALQRAQIATLKAVGYSNTAIAWFYIKLISVIVAIGAVIGIGFGVWMGQSMTGLYRDYFHFPNFRYQLPWYLPVVGVGVSWFAAMTGTLRAVIRVATLPPSVALRPAAPAAYRGSILERYQVLRWFKPMSRMIVRYLLRRPWRTLLTSIGIGCSVAIMILGLFWNDAIDFIIGTQFNFAERQQASVVFTEPVKSRSQADLNQLPGVIAVEGYRMVPIRIQAQHRQYDTTLTAYPPNLRLKLLLNSQLKPLKLLPKRLYFSRGLQKQLGVSVGEQVQIEILDGKRRKFQLPISGFVDDFIGLPAYMDLATLNQLLQEGDLINAAYLTFDTHQQQKLYQALKQAPQIATIQIRRSLIQVFEETFAKHIIVFTGFLCLFACIIAVGVVYNSVRITLSERAWELASLRVLGFTRAEVTKLLVGGLTIEVMVGIPLGFLLGFGLAWISVDMIPNEIFRMPLKISWFTYGFAAVVTSFAGVISALIVKRKVDHLDLTAVLRTLE